jgi:hypothetical protein
MNTVICTFALCLIGIVMIEGIADGHYNRSSLIKDTITATCGGNCFCDSPMAPGAVISHSNYNEYWQNNRNCWWKILVNNPTLRFTFFQTEYIIDPVIISRCDNVDCSMYETLQTYHSPSGDYTQPLEEVVEYRTDFGIYITFTSGPWERERGFRAYFDTFERAVVIETECEANTYCVDGVKLSCPDGTGADPGSTECAPCEVGEYLSSSGCLQCEANTYCVDGVKLSCPDGTGSDPGSTECAPCEVGEYLSIRGCRVVADGYYNHSIGIKDTITATCGGNCLCDPVQMASDAFISSSNVIEYYKNDRNCWWKILVKNPTLRFTYGETEYLNDPVIISRCDNVDCSIHETLHTYHSPSNYYWPTFGEVVDYRTDFGIYITFTSNHAQLFQGFRAYFDTVGTEVLTETECEANTYCVDGVKFSCPFGTDSDPGSTECAACEVGEYSSSSGCLQCEANTYCVAAVKHPCPVGKESDPGSSRCWSVPGNYTDVTTGIERQCEGNTYCLYGLRTPCPNGTYASPGSSECAACVADTYPSSSGCLICPVGTRSRGTDDVCCAIGTSLQDPPPITCRAANSSCSAGSYSTYGSDPKECSQCPQGMFSEARAFECSNCSAGMYSETGESCSFCPDGKYTVVGQFGCSDCLGDQVTNYERTGCICPEGTSIVEGDQGECTECLAGTKSISTRVECEICGVNTWSGAGSNVCHACPGDQVTNYERTECICPEGTSLVEGDQGECIECLAGTKSIPSQVVCEICGVNTWSGARSNVCHMCPADSVSSVGSTSLNTCSCVSGFVRDENDPWGCSMCGVGRYNDMVGNDECIQCPAGTASNNIGATSLDACIPCGVNTWSGTGSNVCHMCPVNSVSSVGTTSLNTCSCVTGFVRDGNDPWGCSMCGVGRYNDVEGNDECIQCPAGTASNNLGATSLDACIPCGVNTWSGDGSNVCHMCPVNSVSSVGTTSLNTCSCVTGFVRDENDPWGCSMCGVGRYNDVVGNDECIQCPSGTASNNVGATSLDTCIPCGVNTWSGAGLNVCHACPTGLVSTYERTGCVCPEGFFRVEGDQGACTECPAGTKSISPGVECEICDVNTWSGAGSNVCHACPEDQATNYERTECVCPEGTTPGEASATRANCICNAGYGYTALADGNACTACAAGTYKTVTGAFSCTPCGAGMYAETTGQTSCMPCPADTYSVAARLTCQSLQSFARTSFPWTTIQQNDEFLALLQGNPPAGINIGSHYTSNTVPDARGSTYTHTVTITDSPVVTIPINEKTEVVSLYGDIGTVWEWPPLPPTYTRCWAVRNTVVANWTVACYKNSPSLYIVDQVTIIDSSTEQVPVLAGVTANENFLHSTYTWNTALTSTEMKVVTMALRKEIGGVPYQGSLAVTQISDLRAYYMRFLMAVRPVRGINIFADAVFCDGWYCSYVPNRMGPGFRSEIMPWDRPRIISYAGGSNGAENPITVLRGNQLTYMRWPAQSIPVKMTICSVSRCISGGTCRRIFNGVNNWNGFMSGDSSNNLFHGHAYGKRGIVSYNNQAKTQLDSSVGGLNNWLVICGKTGGVSPNNVIMDQVAIGIDSGSAGLTGQLNINMYESSDFEVHSLYVWDVELSGTQMKHVTAALRAQIGGAPDLVVGNAVGPVVVPMTPAPTAYEQVCPSGAYMAHTTTNGDCTYCGEGAYVDIQVCICFPGYKVSRDGGVCTPCGLNGTYSNTDDASECTPCLAGTYANTRGASSCTSCVDGTYSDTGASSCTSCVMGTYSNTAGGSSMCTPCVAGTYSDTTGASSCTSCLRGTYSLTEGSSSACTSCLPGTYSGTVGASTECTSCEKGSF